MKCVRLQSLLVLLEFITYSKIRTTHLLTVSRSIPCISVGGSASHAEPQMQIPPRGRQPPEADHSVNRITHASKNITLPQTSFAGGN